MASALSVSQIVLGAWLPMGAIAQDSPRESLPPDAVVPVQTESDKLLAAQQIADLLPAETAMALFFSSDRADWETLQQFELFAKLAEFTEGAAGGFLDGGLDTISIKGPPIGTEGAERWHGNQFAVAVLPDTTPRSIAVTDIEKEMVLIAPVANAAAIEAYQEKLETLRSDAPEKSAHLDAELWVWPSEEFSFDDYDNPLDLPDVPHEDWPSDEFSKTELSKTELSKTNNELKTRRDAMGFGKALNSESPAGLPSPRVFEPEPDYGSYTSRGGAIAFLEGYVVYADEPAALKKLLNYRQFNYDRLSDNPLFSRSEYAQEAGAIARVYADLSEVSKANIDGSALPAGAPPFPGIPDIPGLPGGFPGFPTTPSPIMRQETQAQIASALKGITIEGIIYPQAEGIRVQGRVYGNNLLRSNPTPELDYADSALEFVPAATYSFNSGRDIAGIWQQVARNLSLNVTTREYLQQARDFVKTSTGLDLDAELIGWMDREFVLFFFPSSKGALNSFSPGLGVEIGVAIQTSDRPTAQNTLDTIDGLLSLFAQPTTVNGTPVVSWQAPSFGFGPDAPPAVSYLSHGWISEDTLIITSGTGAMSQLLNPVGFAPISEHPTFLNATDTLAKPNNGYGYFNAGSSFSLAYGLITQWLEVPADDPFFQTVKSYLGTIRGAGSTTSSTAAYWQLDSLLNLAPAEGDRDPVEENEPVE